MKIEDLQSCNIICSNWLKDSLSILNDAQKVEFDRLVAFAKATIYQYQQILSLKPEGVFSKIVESQAQDQRLAILQVERDLSASSIPIQFAYRYVQFQKKVNKSYETDNPNKELQLTSILLDYYIRDKILFQITHGKHKNFPDCASKIVDNINL